MKTLFVILLTVSSWQLSYAQSEGLETKAVLDSLRYYPISNEYYNTFKNVTKFNHSSPIGTTYGRNYEEIEPGYLLFDVSYIGGDCGMIDSPSKYLVKIDSTKGSILRNLNILHCDETYNNYRILGNWVLNADYYFSTSNPFRKVSDATTVFDEVDHKVEQLYFSTPPAVGDTVIKGSSQFGVEVDWNYRNDSFSLIRGDGIPYTIYRGYVEKTDRELGFENPQDTVIQMIQFQNDDLVYTLAKDIGLLHIDRITLIGEEETLTRVIEMSTVQVGKRRMKRPDFVVVSTEEEPHAPTEFQLHANRPNPFNPSTELSFTLQQAQTVSLEVTDMLGRRMSLPLSLQRLSAGTHRVTINAQRWASGVYFYHLTTELGSATKKMMLVK